MQHRQPSILFSVALSSCLASLALADQILPVTAEAWPNGRTVDSPPAYAADGDLDSHTWSTEPYNLIAPCYLGLDFGAAKNLNRLRLWKDNDSGYYACLGTTWALTIEYTMDKGPMSSRSWQNVSNLETGYMMETLQAASVSNDGNVTGEAHDSVNEAHGWASLTFDGVKATGVRIGFTSSCGINHYKVHEFEAHFEDNSTDLRRSSWGDVKTIYR